MLVLTRGEQQTIRIGDDVIITLNIIRGSRARIGIEAPEGVKVLRGELVEDGEEKEAAA